MRKRLLRPAGLVLLLAVSAALLAGYAAGASPIAAAWFVGPQALALLTTIPPPDTLAPTTTSDIPASGEYIDEAVITLTAVDGPDGDAVVSGVDWTLYSLDGSDDVTYTVPVTVSAEGEHTIRFWSGDVAGNIEDEKTESFEIVASAPPVADKYAPVAVEGATRYETAIEASKKGFPDGADTVVIATGENWPDALGGAALAGAYDGPILLTPAAVLPDTVLAEIDRLEAGGAFILGGTGAVSPAVETALAGKLGATNVTRVGGSDRYVTAELIARGVKNAPSSEFDGTAFVATGLNFPDALAGSPLAAAGDWPIFLAPEGGLTASTASTMDDIGVSDILILGGTGVVSQSIQDALAAETDLASVMRLAGATRYSTAVAVAAYGVDDAGLDWDGVALATGENFPDALAGGVLQGMDESVMLLTPSASLAPEAEAALSANKGDITAVKFLGGPGAISQAVRDSVAQVLQ